MSTASWNQSKRFANRAEIARFFSRDEKVTQYLCWFDHLYFAWYLSIDTWFRYHFDENFGNFAKNYDLLIENSRERLFVEFRVCCNSIAHLLEGPKILLQHMPTFTFPSLTTISKIPAAATGMHHPVGSPRSGCRSSPLTSSSSGKRRVACFCWMKLRHVFVPWHVEILSPFRSTKLSYIFVSFSSLGIRGREIGRLFFRNRWRGYLMQIPLDLLSFCTIKSSISTPSVYSVYLCTSEWG